MLSVPPVFILWPQMAVKTVHYLRGDFYHFDGWIRGGDGLGCQGEHWPFCERKLDQRLLSSISL